MFLSGRVRAIQYKEDWDVATYVYQKESDSHQKSEEDAKRNKTIYFINDLLNVVDGGEH